MSVPPKRRFRVTNLRLREISSVDWPAQAGAVSVLVKRRDAPADGDIISSAGEEHVTDTEIRKSAAAVAAGEAPAFSVDDYEGAMLRRADEIAQEHDRRITPEQALAKGLRDDPQLMDLANACDAARHAGYAAEVRKRRPA